MRTLYEERCEAMALLKAGKKPSEVATQLQRHESWVRKWRKRFEENGYTGLQEQSRRPKKPRQLSAEVREAIITARMHLEGQASQGMGLKYIGGRAVRSYLRRQEF
jgi:transposase